MSGESVYRPGISGIVRPSQGRRSRGRLKVDELVASIGPVLDLSAGGMRTVVSRVKRGTFPIQIHTPEGVLLVEGRVVWSRRHGFMRHEVGIEFVNVNEDTAKILGNIAMQNRNQRIAGWDHPG